MTSNSGAENLGSAYSLLGFRYDESGANAFFAALQKIKTAQDAFDKQQGASPTTTRRPVSPRPNAPTRDKDIQSTIKLANAEAQLARRLGDSAGELTALRRAQAAATSDRLAYLRATERVAAAEQRLRKGGSGGGGSPVLPRSFAGFTQAGALQLAGALGVATSATELLQQGLASIGKANSLEKTEATTRALSGSTERYLQVLQIAREGQRLYGGTLEENLRGLGTLVNLSNRAGVSLKDLDNVARRLAIVDPLQGIDGANVALKEFLNGSGGTAARSLKERFEIPGAALKELTKEGLSTQEKLAGLDRVLTDLGFSNEVLANRTQTTAATYDQLLAAIDNVKVAAGASLAQDLEAAARGLTALLSGGENNTRQLEQQAAAAITASSSYQDYAASAKKIIEANAGVFGSLDILTPAQYEYVQALRATGVSAEEALLKVMKLRKLAELLQPAPEQPKTFKDNIVDILSYNPGVDRTGEIAAGQQEVLDRLGLTILDIGNSSEEAAKEVAVLVANFRAGQPAEDFERSVRALAERLSEQKREAGRVASANAQLAASNREAALSGGDLEKAQKSLTDALIQGSDQITEALQRRNDQLNQLEERHTTRVKELQADQLAAAKETQAEIKDATADGVAQRTKLEQEGAERISDTTAEYTDRRQEIIEDGNERLADLEQRYRDEDLRAERDYANARLSGRASFLRQLNQLTNQRGGGGAKARAEAKAQRAANQAQVDALAQIDPAAAAELQKELDQQLLDNLQRKQENAQRVKDARRGGSLSSAEAQRQIDEEARAEQEAQQARIEAIKQGATDRQKQREQERADATADTTKQLQDLDESYAKDLKRLKAANQEKLDEFDARQKERIAQIEKHGREQQAALQNQLDRETAQYVEQQTKIKAEYEKTRQELIDDLNERAAELFLPDETKQKELADAARVLGTTIGSEFIAGLQGTIESGKLQYGAFPDDPNQREPQPQRRPPAPDSPGAPGKGPGPASPQAAASGARNRGSVVGVKSDPVLTDSAIDQVVTGGRQSDGYNSLRGDKLHAGVDIATPLNSPVKSPIDGTISVVGSTATGGNYVMVRGANGEEWYFGHLNSALVPQGAQVKRGQVIARSGATGSAVTGPHVHVQRRDPSGKVVDPTNSLERLAGAAGAGATGGSSGPRPQSTGGKGQVSSAPHSIPGESIGGARALDQFAAQAPSTVSAPVDQSVTVDMRGAQFGAGVSPQQVKEAVTQGVKEGLDAERRAISQQISQQGTKGALAL